jgi:hypothetical protein
VVLIPNNPVNLFKGDGRGHKTTYLNLLTKWLSKPLAALHFTFPYIFDR